jgi:pimeloyl-ACP methyl ester carboxylesterase
MNPNSEAVQGGYSMKSDDLTRVRTVQLSQGPIQYLDIGDGPVLLFVHGLLVNGEMWRKVYRPLSAHFRCIVPTLPLGGHSEPMPEDADLTPPGVARSSTTLWCL